VSHNIEWHAVVSLLEAIGSVVQHNDGKVAVTSAPSLSSGARPGCAGGPGQTASSTRSRPGKCRRAPG